MSDSMLTDPVDPGDKRTFRIDYSVLLAELGPTAAISASTWELPAELEQISETHDTNSTEIKLDFAGASIGTNYTCYNRIETNGGDARRRAMIIPVRDAATFSQASTVKENLEAIRAAIAGNATRAQRRRQIGDKTIEWMTPEELMVAETKWQQLYNQEKRNERLRNGEPFLKNVQTRFMN